MKSVWILTEEYNDYDQHGEYFVNVYPSKPTPDQLIADGVNPGETDHVLAGGGRQKLEYQWFFLREHKLKEHHD